jgi:predicted amino acid dehydrogenase
VETLLSKIKNSIKEVKKMRKFAFLVHPRDISDVGRKFKITKILPHRMTEKFLLKLKNGVLCSKFDVFGKGEGYILGIPLTAIQMKKSPQLARQKILEAVLIAQNKYHVQLVGLGALTASFTQRGVWLTRIPEVKVKITHGDTYAVAVTEEAIEKIIELCKFNRGEVEIAIVGATGTIGEALTKIFNQKRYRLILIGKSRMKLEALKGELIKNDVFTSVELKDIYDADIIVTATSHPGALVKADYLKQGSIIYDVAQPPNVSSEEIRGRTDILRIDGAYVWINGIDVNFDMGPPPGVTFACLAETIMEALEKENDHYVGKVGLDHVRKTKSWAEKYGFRIAPFTNFGETISLERFRQISELNFNGKLLRKI